MLGNLLTVFIAGRFSDAWGRKTALFVFQSLSGIFMLTVGLVSNFCHPSPVGTGGQKWLILGNNGRLTQGPWNQHGNS